MGVIWLPVNFLIDECSKTKYLREAKFYVTNGLCTFFRSKAEVASVRRAILYEFPFGVQYAWMMLIFAMTIIYSVSCPLITPFGKHLVPEMKPLLVNVYIVYCHGHLRIKKFTCMNRSKFFDPLKAMTVRFMFAGVNLLTWR